MPKTFTITVYPFEELSETAKERAINDFRNMESLMQIPKVKNVVEYFNIKNWVFMDNGEIFNIDYFNTYCNF